MGYDISNYEAVHAPYGTVQDMDVLIAECHRRGMRLVLDLVVNHTSDQHAWFRESRASRDSPKRDWYIWRPPRVDPATGERRPPTNWRSYFSGPAWEWDEATGEYYLHLFAREQPDLNWESEACRRAVYDSAMRFWLNKGVDGFRIDTVNMYSKGPVEDLRDAEVEDPDAEEQPAWKLYANGPRMHEFLREMNEEVLDKYETMTVGGAFSWLFLLLSSAVDHVSVAFASLTSLDRAPAHARSGSGARVRQRVQEAAQHGLPVRHGRPGPGQHPQVPVPAVDAAAAQDHRGKVADLHRRHRRLDDVLLREPRPGEVRLAVRLGQP